MCVPWYVLILKWFVPTECLLVPVYIGNVDVEIVGTLKMVTLCFSMYDDNHRM